MDKQTAIKRAPASPRMRPYTAPLDEDRCSANAATAAGNEGGRCMHRRIKGCKLCGQHAAVAYTQLVEALQSMVSAMHQLGKGHHGDVVSAESLLLSLGESV